MRLGATAIRAAFGAALLLTGAVDVATTNAEVCGARDPTAVIRGDGITRRFEVALLSKVDRAGCTGVFTVDLSDPANPDATRSVDVVLRDGALVSVPVAPPPDGQYRTIAVRRPAREALPDARVRREDACKGATATATATVHKINADGFAVQLPPRLCVIEGSPIGTVGGGGGTDSQICCHCAPVCECGFCDGFD